MPFDFNNIKRTGFDDSKKEFWQADQLQLVYGYDEWSDFHDKIKKAMVQSADPTKYFVSVSRKKQNKSGKWTISDDYNLSREACYLIALNCDSKKSGVRDALIYFSSPGVLSEKKPVDAEEARLFARWKLEDINKRLSSEAARKGVSADYDHSNFSNNIYKAVYGGLKATEVADKKGLKEGENYSDFMSTEELELQEETKKRIIFELYNIPRSIDIVMEVAMQQGKEIRKTRAQNKQILPEDLSLEEKNIKQIEREKKQEALEKVKQAKPKQASMF